MFELEDDLERFVDPLDFDDEARLALDDAFLAVFDDPDFAEDRPPLVLALLDDGLLREEDEDFLLEPRLADDLLDFLDAAPPDLAFAEPVFVDEPVDERPAGRDDELLVFDALFFDAELPLFDAPPRDVDLLDDEPELLDDPLFALPLRDEAPFDAPDFDEEDPDFALFDALDFDEPDDLLPLLFFDDEVLVGILCPLS